MATKKKPAAKSQPAAKRKKGKPAPMIESTRPAAVPAFDKPKKPRKKATAPPPPPDESKLTWAVNPAEETWGTTVEPVRRWSTKCGRYDVVRVKPAEEREYFGATKVSKDGGKVCFESDKMGPGYPKKYATLDAAMESVEVHHAALHRLAGVTSNRDAVVNQAEKMGLSRRAAPTAAKPAPISRVATDKGKKDRPGVIATVIESLRAASEITPMSKKDLGEILARKFPERSPESMMKTVNVQVPFRLRKDKNIKVLSNEEGYWIGK